MNNKDFVVLAMAIINLRKYYDPTYKKDIFIEVSDEVAEVLLLMLRAQNNDEQKRNYHKTYFSLDCEDGIENDAIGWAQPSPEDYMVEWEEQMAHERLLLYLQQSFSILTPPQARRLHARYLLGMKIKDISAEEQARKEQQRLDRIRRLKANGLQDRALFAYSFDKAEGDNPAIKYAYRYVKHWTEVKVEGQGLLLWGGMVWILVVLDSILIMFMGSTIE